MTADLDAPLVVHWQLAVLASGDLWPAGSPPGSIAPQVMAAPAVNQFLLQFPRRQPPGDVLGRADVPLNLRPGQWCCLAGVAGGCPPPVSAATALLIAMRRLRWPWFLSVWFAQPKLLFLHALQLLLGLLTAPRRPQPGWLHSLVCSACFAYVLPPPDRTSRGSFLCLAGSTAIRSSGAGLVSPAAAAGSLGRVLLWVQ